MNIFRAKAAITAYAVGEGDHDFPVCCSVPLRVSFGVRGTLITEYQRDTFYDLGRGSRGGPFKESFGDNDVRFQGQ